MIDIKADPIVRFIEMYEGSLVAPYCDPEYVELVAIFSFLKQGGRLDRGIDYQYYASVFNKYFFVRNLLKVNSLVGRFCIKNYASQSFSILDVGAGSGAATIGWLLNKGNLTDSVILVDVCGAQLKTAAKNLEVVGFRNASYLNEWFDPFSNYGETIRFFSYWFCEQPIGFDSDKRFWHLVFGGASLILDYPHVIDEILRNLPANYLSVRCSTPIKGLDLENVKNLRIGVAHGVFIYEAGSDFCLF